MTNNTLHIICLTKSYNLLDFETWYKYYRSLGGNIVIHVIDNDSSVDIKSIVKKPDTYEKMEGWPNQWKLFDTILNQNTYNITENDYVIFADDDEYFWFDGRWEARIGDEFLETPLDVICVPQIYMSSMHLNEQRSAPYVFTNYYRRNDFSSQGKSIILYSPHIKYCFSKNNREVGHIPFTKYPGSKEWFRMAKVVGSDITKDSTYGLTAHEAGIRLYHYHLKSLDDWKNKWARGSAACEKHPYEEDIHKNPGYGGYDTIDLTMKKYFEKI